MKYDGPRYENRRDAGRFLAALLHHFAAAQPLVLALPRGGVPVAYEVAKALDAELDLLIVRKLGAPGHPELGLGAVIDGGSPQVVINAEIVRQTGTSEAYLRDETDRQLLEIERRRKEYRGNAPPPIIAGRTVIVVDDGIATGGTMLAALRALRKAEPEQLILAVPVAPHDVLASIGRECDALICPYQPDPFYAVGAHYQDFDQTSDTEVKVLLESARAFGGAIS